MTPEEIDADIRARNARMAERYRATERYAYGWTDPRAMYGTRITWLYRLRCWWRDDAWPRLRYALRRSWRWIRGW